jgi:hypothetical protein
VSALASAEVVINPTPSALPPVPTPTTPAPAPASAPTAAAAPTTATPAPTPTPTPAATPALSQPQTQAPAPTPSLFSYLPPQVRLPFHVLCEVAVSFAVSQRLRRNPRTIRESCTTHCYGKRCAPCSRTRDISSPRDTPSTSSPTSVRRFLPKEQRK